MSPMERMPAILLLVQVCGRAVRVSRALRKPKPSGHAARNHGRGPPGGNAKNRSPDKKHFNPKTVVNGKQVGADNKKAKKNFKKKAWVKPGDEKKPFNARFTKKSARDGQSRKSFQGFTTSLEGTKIKKPRWNKADKKKKIIAEKLAS